MKSLSLSKHFQIQLYTRCHLYNLAMSPKHSTGREQTITSPGVAAAISNMLVLYKHQSPLPLLI